jgi:peptide/nickel transport system permease protein
MTRVGWALLGLTALAAAAAPWLAPNPPDERFNHLIYAPPTVVYLYRDGFRPHIYPLRVVNRRERRFESDPGRPVALRWFSAGTLVTADPDGGSPLLLLGADAFGRDIFARVLYGARVTAALALTSTLLAVGLGAFIGGVAGYAGGWVDALFSRASELLLVLPAIYVILAIRAAMPLAPSPVSIFFLLTGIFALLGWPIVARGVRAIVASERHRDYAVAAAALGSGPLRVVVHHLLPAARGYIAVQSTLLVPAFVLAEATLSYVGLGFPDTIPTWGTMLREATQVAFGETPWALAPAGAIFLVVLGVNLAVQGAGHAPVQLEP